jgi:Xaa-Pro aminopeptidase
MPNDRVKRLRGKIAEAGGQAIMVGSEINRRYLSGFSGTHGVVLASADRAALLTDFRYRLQAGQQATGFEIIEHGADLTETIAEKLKAWGVSRLLFEDRQVTSPNTPSWRQSWPPSSFFPPEASSKTCAW